MGAVAVSYLRVLLSPRHSAVSVLVRSWLSCRVSSESPVVGVVRLSVARRFRLVPAAVQASPSLGRSVLSPRWGWNYVALSGQRKWPLTRPDANARHDALKCAERRRTTNAHRVRPKLAAGAARLDNSRFALDEARALHPMPLSLHCQKCQATSASAAPVAENPTAASADCEGVRASLPS